MTQRAYALKARAFQTQWKLCLRVIDATVNKRYIALKWTYERDGMRLCMPCVPPATLWLSAQERL